MSDTLAAVAPAFVEMAHRIVWASAATVDSRNQPRSRILHPLWEWDGESLVGWIATGPTPAKTADIEHSPYVSLSYWTPDHDTCRADCRVTWHFDDDVRTRIWDAFKNAPAPVGYDPAIIPVWDKPTSPTFAALELTPEFLRVFPGTALIGAGGDVLTWRSPPLQPT